MSYELGLAHAMGVPTVLVAHQDSCGDIPFDLRQYRTEFYDTHFQGAGAIIEACRNWVSNTPLSKFLLVALFRISCPEQQKPAIRRHRTGTTGISPSESGGIAKAREPQEIGDEAQMKRLLLQTAALLDNYSDRLETDQPRYEQVVERITSNGLGYMTLLAGHADQYRDELESTLQASASLRDTS
jgi:hypothetical protein